MREGRSQESPMKRFLTRRALQSHDVQHATQLPNVRVTRNRAVVAAARICASPLLLHEEIESAGQQTLRAVRFDGACRVALQRRELGREGRLERGGGLRAVDVSFVIGP
ncbi:hypothetical protein CYMTET_43663 [Cymbomonas tetramitiformis]|uniref:Uncharacterized protein n=1 Tax=Cymbomonas tetramitiformis TaxID=36881 RepID=A0AAE0F028_9CHLO|nr:hypothetical protein CYMTET_43663 [Cymbomonas tetramitiformis]